MGPLDDVAGCGGFDQANADWHRAITDALRRYKVGQHIGGSATVGHPEIVPPAFAPETWQKLRALRDHSDPERAVFDPFESSAGDRDRPAGDAASSDTCG